MKKVAAEASVGGSVGLFLGLLVGMSVSPVVGIVVSGITGILAALLGLGSVGAESAANKTQERLKLSSHSRMIAFGLAATLGLVLGLWIRTHNLLSPSRSEDVHAWTEAGWSPEEARALRVYSELGIAPSGSKPGEGGAKPGTTSVLYANYREQCRSLEPQRYKDESEAINAWQLEKGVWSAMADVIRKSGTTSPMALMKSSWNTLCAE